MRVSVGDGARAVWLAAGFSPSAFFLLTVIVQSMPVRICLIASLLLLIAWAIAFGRTLASGSGQRPEDSSGAVSALGHMVRWGLIMLAANVTVVVLVILFIFFSMQDF